MSLGELCRCELGLPRPLLQRGLRLAQSGLERRHAPGRRDAGLRSVGELVPGDDLMQLNDVLGVLVDEPARAVVAPPVSEALSQALDLRLGLLCARLEFLLRR